MRAAPNQQTTQGTDEIKFPVRPPISKDYEVPEISDDRIKALSEEIRALMRDQNGKLRYVPEHNLREFSFRWHEKKGAVADGLVEIGRITTFHPCAYHGFFKPTVAEVLAQIPADLLTQVAAFETCVPPHDNWREVTNEEGDCHRGITTLYAKAKKA